MNTVRGLCSGILLSLAASSAAATPLIYVSHSQVGRVSVIDAATNQVVKEVGTALGPNLLTADSSGLRVYVDSASNTPPGLSVINALTHATSFVTVPSATFGSYLRQPAAHPTQSLLYVPIWPDKLAVINTTNNTLASTETLTVGTNESVRAIAFDPSGNPAYYTIEGSTAVGIFDTALNQDIGSISGGGEGAIVMNADGSRAYSSKRSNPEIAMNHDLVTAIDTANESASSIPVAPYCDNILDLKLNPSGTRLYVACYQTMGSGKLLELDTASNTITLETTLGTFYPNRIGITPDGAIYMTDLLSATLAQFDATLHAIIDTITFESSVTAIAVGPEFVCGNTTIDPGEGCDDGNLADGDGCNSSCYRVHDPVIAPIKPVTLKIPLGEATAIKEITVKVINADILPEPDPNAVLMQVTPLIPYEPSSPCYGLEYSDVDFGVGTGNYIYLSGGASKKGKFRVTAQSEFFHNHNRTTPTRCRFTVTARLVNADFTVDPNPSNNSTIAEVNVINANQEEMTTLHETAITAIKPLKAKISAGKVSISKVAKPTVLNADYLPTEESAAAHSVSASVDSGDCPVGLVGAVTFKDSPTVEIGGGDKAKGSLPLNLTAAGLVSPNKLSPARCIATITADGPDGDSDATNDSTSLVIDVVDGNDFP